MKLLIASKLALLVISTPINEHCKMDDAALNIRQYTAALLPINSGCYLESMIAKLAGATIVASN